MILSLLKANKPFAFNRFGEGELNVIDGKAQERAEYTFNPNKQESLRSQLEQSLKYTAGNYYIGLNDGLGFKGSKWRTAHTKSGYINKYGIDPKMVWDSHLFYDYQSDGVTEYFPYFQGANLVCSDKANLESLPFRVGEVFTGAAKNAWYKSPDLPRVLSHAVKKGGVWLFSLGPFTNILIHQCHMSNPHGTYLDIGSSLDIYYFGQWTRGKRMGQKV